VLGFVGTLLLVLVGLLNFSVFRKQLRIAKDQIDTAVRQLEIAQKQPDLYLIQRSVTETSNHLRLFVEHPKLRPYFYGEAEWNPSDEVSLGTFCHRLTRTDTDKLTLFRINSVRVVCVNLWPYFTSK
jgi:hypothetical protein